MGATQSKTRDSYTQTPPVEYHKTHIKEPLGSCSDIKHTPTCTAPQTTINISYNTQPNKPPQKRQKYNRTRSNPRTLLPIKEEKSIRNTTDAVTGQCTPKDLTSFTELRESMRRKKTVKRADVSDKYEMKNRNNSSLPVREFKENKNEKSVDLTVSAPSIDKNETTEKCFQAAFNYYNLTFPNENLFSDVDDNDERNQDNPYGEMSSQLNYYSDSSDHSDSLKKLPYGMCKDYYYL